MPTGTEYTCPMHPEIVRNAPGTCPICGMTLEPRTVALGEDENLELRDMLRRFWVSAVLGAPILLLAMAEMISDGPVGHLLPAARAVIWIEMILATPVVLWGGWPFFERGWQSIINRSPNMFTLIALGVGTASVYSVMATLFSGFFPPSFRGHAGEVPVYLEAAAMGSGSDVAMESADVTLL
jgi:P-type Cu+ transporter